MSSGSAAETVHVVLCAPLRLSREMLGASLTRAGLDVDLADQSSSAPPGDPADVVVAVSDGGRPGEFGELLRLAQVQQPLAPVLVVGPDQREQLEAALAVGAREYVTFRASLDELVAKIVAVAHGHFVVVSIPSSRPRDLQADQPRRRRVDRLSDRELEILGMVARGASTEEIASALALSVPAVRSHVHRILAKLEAHSRLEAAAIAAGRGIE